MALIYVSLDGDKWQESPIKFSTKSEAIKDTAVNITINLKSRVGRYIKICLYFPGRWLLISEVSFESGKYNTIIITITIYIHGLYRNHNNRVT